MMSIDKSCEPDATAALAKLKQKEQVSWNANKFSIYNSNWVKMLYHFLCLFHLMCRKLRGRLDHNLKGCLIRSQGILLRLELTIGEIKGWVKMRRTTIRRILMGIRSFRKQKMLHLRWVFSPICGLLVEDSSLLLGWIDVPYCDLV